MCEIKNIIITGASSGLGKALAFELASCGANLTLAARRIELLEELKQEINKKYPKSQILVIKTDITNQNSCENLIHESIKYFGALDIFIANAGQSMWSRFCDIKNPKELDNLMQLNYMGVVYAAFYALPYLRQSHGSFVAISSIQGALPVPFHTGYVASKYALTGFIDALRLEEKNIHFLLAMPSWISGTELRNHALRGQAPGSIEVKKNHGKNNAISARECAELIIKALKAKKNKIYIPNRYKYLVALRQFFPALIDYLILKRVKKQLR